MATAPELRPLPEEAMESKKETRPKGKETLPPPPPVPERIKAEVAEKKIQKLTQEIGQDIGKTVHYIDDEGIVTEAELRGISSDGQVILEVNGLMVTVSPEKYKEDNEIPVVEIEELGAEEIKEPKKPGLFDKVKGWFSRRKELKAGLKSGKEAMAEETAAGGTLSQEEYKRQMQIGKKAARVEKGRKEDRLSEEVEQARLAEGFEPVSLEAFEKSFEISENQIDELKKEAVDRGLSMEEFDVYEELDKLRGEMLKDLQEGKAKKGTTIDDFARDLANLFFNKTKDLSPAAQQFINEKIFGNQDLGRFPLWKVENDFTDTEKEIISEAEKRGLLAYEVRAILRLNEMPKELALVHLANENTLGDPIEADARRYATEVLEGKIKSFTDEEEKWFEKGEKITEAGEEGLEKLRMEEEEMAELEKVGKKAVKAKTADVEILEALEEEIGKETITIKEFNEILDRAVEKAGLSSKQTKKLKHLLGKDKPLEMQLKAIYRNEAVRAARGTAISSEEILERTMDNLIEDQVLRVA